MNMSDHEQIEQRVEVVRAAIKNLREHFDTVQIFVTACEGNDKGETRHISLGAGNWFARYGQINNWLVEVEERARLEAQQEEGGL